MQAENLATLMIKLSAWNADEIEGASIPIDDYQKIASLATRIAGQLGIDMKRIVKDVSLLDTFGKEVS